jgi:hypothetical protein
VPSHRSRERAGCGWHFAAVPLLAALYVAYLLVHAALARVTAVTGRTPRAGFLLGLVLGLAPLVPAVIGYRRRVRGVRHPWRGWLGVVSGVLGVAILVGLPGRYGETDEERRETPYVAPGALTGAVLLAGAAIVLERRYPRPPPPPPDPAAEPAPRADRLRRRRPGHTAVTLLHVVPGPAEPDPWIPYWAATCECGWVGESYVTETEARADALAHAPGVDPVVQRVSG